MVADTGLEPVASFLSGMRSETNVELIRQTGAEGGNQTLVTAIPVRHSITELHRQIIPESGVQHPCVATTEVY